jgi:hypothetical protein
MINIYIYMIWNDQINARTPMAVVHGQVREVGTAPESRNHTVHVLHGIAAAGIHLLAYRD